MTSSSATPLTGLSTSPSKPLYLLTVELTIEGRHARLVAKASSQTGVLMVREWRFTSETLSAPLLDEIGAWVDHAALSGLLAAVGMQLRLAVELEEALGDLRRDFS